MTDSLFHEEQLIRSNRLWRISLIFSAGIIVLFAYALYQQLYLNIPFGNTPASDQGLILIAIGNFILAVGLPIFLYQSKLIVRVNQEEVLLHYAPFRRRSIKLNAVEGVEVCEFNPWEYGGWGIKFSMKGNGWAYTVRGKKAVRLSLSDGKKLVLGSEKPVELAAAIQQAKRT